MRQMERRAERERVAAWIERKRGLLMYGFYAEAGAKEEGLPIAAVRAHLDEMVMAGGLVVRRWEVFCPRCDQAHEFPSPRAAEDEVCLRCGEELDPAQAVPLFSFRREG